ncbi:hypothetical protein BJ878DRAFT_521536 [Calycina marina]|uniref:Uncharacterized protein n=1 Tax=Calycina marina TaxID=1763456 RepID=A0A9P8CC45_9HELO|nr:hypothetical protein BJ878DRAFT_521536 [Calycina marina]
MRSSPDMSRTKFFGSQVGGKAVVPLTYTGSPAQLLRADICNAFRYIGLLPYVMCPVQPKGSGKLCELYASNRNIYCIFLHIILVLLQLPFILSVPLWFVMPVPLFWIAGGVVAFWLVNEGICQLLNGKEMRFMSDPKYSRGLKEHRNEQWIFLNGVSVGKSWMEGNLDRLALTFGRPVLGVHNKTAGILFDVLQCLIQRNFNYATQDIRDCYAIVKETLYKKELTKVVFILHSQGGIEGGMILDWLLQEVPQDLLAKLEVYTFGNAANHFNNPHLHMLSEVAALASPVGITTTKTTTQVHYYDPIVEDSSGASHIPNTIRSARKTSGSDKTIRYIEHYAHTFDFVARWGVLFSTATPSQDATAPKFMGRVFEHNCPGHLLNQHYLDNMFPLKPSNEKGGGIGGSGFDGAADECDFMNSTIDWAAKKNEHKKSNDEREGLESSFHTANRDPLDKGDGEVLLRDISPVSPVTTRLALESRFKNGRGFTETGSGNKRKMDFKVKDLSRLWLYRNGGSPRFDEMDFNIERMATV